MPYKDKSKQVENVRRWRIANREKYLAYEKARAKRNRDKNREHSKLWRESNREKDRASKLHWYHNNKGKVDKYRREHREQCNAYKRNWAHRNRPLMALYRSLYRAKHQELGADLTNEQWQSIKIAYKFRCAYCGAKPERLEKDHVIPIKKGGATTATNIVPCCATCNRRKSFNEPPKIPALRVFL